MCFCFWRKKITKKIINLQCEVADLKEELEYKYNSLIDSLDHYFRDVVSKELKKELDKKANTRSKRKPRWEDIPY
jgi:hypothetical protein